MKHWHRCSRWTEKGFGCPFALLGMEDETEVPERGPRSVPFRHAAVAQELVGASVPAKAKAVGGASFWEAVTVLDDIGLVNAVSTQTVEPFEKPIGSPLVATGGSAVAANITEKSRAQPIQSTGPGRDVVGTTTPRVITSTGPSSIVPVGDRAVYRNPRVVEQAVIDQLAATVSMGPSTARPKVAGVGAPASRQGATGDLGIIASYERAAQAQTALQGQINLADVYVLEAALAAAVAYGTIKSFQALRNRSRTFPERGRIIKPRPTLQGRPSSGTGDIPGNQSNFLRTLRAGLARDESPVQ